MELPTRTVGYTILELREVLRERYLKIAVWAHGFDRPARTDCKEVLQSQINKMKNIERTMNNWRHRKPEEAMSKYETCFVGREPQETYIKLAELQATIKHLSQELLR